MMISRNFHESNTMFNQFFNFQKEVSIFFFVKLCTHQAKRKFTLTIGIFAENKFGQDLFTRCFFKGLRHIIHKSRVSLSCVIYLSV